MYPSDNRYPDMSSNMENMGPIYNNQMRPPSMDMSNSRPPYYDTPYYQKTPIMQPPIYEYMSQPPMMPMNQGIDPRYSNWRQSSQNRNSIIPSYYDRPPQPYIHSKGSISAPLPNSIPPISYPDTYPPSHNIISQVRPSQMNLLQRISYLIKPQLPELQKIMIKAANSSITFKKKQHSKRQRSYERQRPTRQRSRSHQKKKHTHNSSSAGQWVCSKCSFLNFEFRDKCKKCNESKPSFPSASSSSGGGRNFIPGPEDWKCNKCGNLNYARRNECNRCKLSKNASK